MAESKARIVVTIRMEPDVWRDLESPAQDVGMDRSALVRQVMRWWLGVPGAQLPPRPGSTD